MSDNFNETVLAMLAAVQDNQVALLRLLAGVEAGPSECDGKRTGLDGSSTELGG